jgi:hypothetical protein
MRSGLDVVEGVAVVVRDEDTLSRSADAYTSKYGPPFGYTAADGALRGAEGHVADLYEVRPTVAFGFGFTPSARTRWRFGSRP